MNNLNVAKIQLNGKYYEINNGTSLNQLLNKLNIQKEDLNNGVYLIELRCGEKSIKRKFLVE